MNSPDELAGLQRLASSLESLRAELRQDLDVARDLAGALDRVRVARGECHASMATTLRLVRRLEGLRQLAETRIRSLERLRATMRRLRGGVRPH